MPVGSDEPLILFAPFVASTMRVEPGWIDYNGHLNMAYYHVLFDRAVDEAFELVGLGPDYIARRNMSYFTAETHTIYRRELGVDTDVRTTVQLVDIDDKRVHAYFAIHHLAEGWVSATCEQLFLHVDMATRKVTPFPPDIRARLEAAKALHAGLPRPAGLGRSVGLGQSAAPPTPER